MAVTVSTPPRLHFGLFAVGNLVEREFGGVGLMVKSPRTVVSVCRSPRLKIVDRSADAHQYDRVTAAANLLKKWWLRYNAELDVKFNDGSILQCSNSDLDINSNFAPHSLPLELSIDAACPRHSGLGSGTQLAMGIGLALQKFFGLPIPKADELAITMGRAGRSAIGTYGSYEGGLLIDRGKQANELVAPIDLRIDFPEHWPIAIVYVHPPAKSATVESATPAGLHGRDEIDAFKSIAATTTNQLKEMRLIASEEIVPGVIDGDYNLFAAGVHRFGRQSGDYFESIQGGSYASPTIAQAVDIVVKSGVQATGQTSWGPSIFAIAENKAQLQPAVDALKSQFNNRCDIQITSADNGGAQIQTNPTDKTA